MSPITNNNFITLFIYLCYFICWELEMFVYINWRFFRRKKGAMNERRYFILEITGNDI